MKILYCVEFSYYWYKKIETLLPKFILRYLKKCWCKTSCLGYPQDLPIRCSWFQDGDLLWLQCHMWCIVWLQCFNTGEKLNIKSFLDIFIIYEFNRIQEKLLYLMITGKNLVSILELQKQSYFIPFTGYCQMQQMSAVFKPRKKESWIYQHLHTYFHFRQ